MNHVNFSTESIKKGFSFHLPSKEIHVWVTNVNKNSPDGFAHSQHEKKTNLDFSLFQKRIESSRKSLRYLLSRYLEISPECLQIEKTERGKPMLLSHPEISFSMAHSGPLLALAFARPPVGIDLERKRNVKAVAIAQKFFTPHEIEFLKHSPEERFFYLWTAKEAALKADGCGITEGLRKAVAVIEKDFITGLHLKQQLMTIIPWSLDAEMENDFIGSVASFVSPESTRIFHTNLLQRPGRPMDAALESNCDLNSMYSYSSASKFDSALPHQPSRPPRHDQYEICGLAFFL